MRTVARIGFIGLGIMGSHMAANLITAGHEVTGYDVVPASVERLLQAGGKPAPNIAGAVSGFISAASCIRNASGAVNAPSSDIR